MKFPLCVAISCGLLAMAPAQAHAKAKQEAQAIVVTGEPVTFKQWSKRLNRALERQMEFPLPALGREPGEGVVRVNFLCSEDGKATAVTLRDSSGNRDIDAAALRAVRRLKTLHPLAEGLSHDQKYQAVLLFAKTPDSYNRQMAAIKRDAERRNAWFAKTGGQVAMGVGLAPAG